MKKYFCDVCGTELGGGPGPASAAQAVKLCRLEDLCPQCEGLAQALDVPALVLEELRRRAQAGRELPGPDSPAAPVPAGKNAGEKREILAAVEAFRREHGAGALAVLARKSGVDEGVLRDIVQCQRVPLATWRKVGRALGASDGKERL